MDQRAQRANLIINANIPGVDAGSSRRVLQYLNRQDKDQYLWLYKEGFKTIYGKFYKSLPIELNDKGDQFHGHREPGYFEREQFAVKSVSIQQYIENVNNMEEDPYNEIKISDHIIRNMNANQIVNNGIIITRGILSNKSQENINNDEKYYFIVSQLANGGDLFEHVMEEGEDNMDTIRNLFRQMVSSIQCLHNEAQVFHRDLSLENFVINNNGDDNERIFVIDFGQAQIIEDGVERVQSTGYFGKPGYTPPELVKEGGKAMDLDWKKCDVWALGITLWLMIFQEYPEWSMKKDPHNNNVEIIMTDVHNLYFDMICRKGGLQRLLEENEIEFLPMHDLLQNILLEDPQHRSSTEDILNHPWLAQN